MSRLANWRRAAAGLLALSGLATGAAALHAAATSPVLALVEEIAPDVLGPEALRLRLETALAAAVTADWLARETDAALAERPPNWSRLDALSDLAAERGISLPPETEARRMAAERDRPSPVWKCLEGVFYTQLPNHPTSIYCYYSSSLFVVADGRDLIGEAAKYAAGEDVDELTVGIAAIGLASTFLPGGTPLKLAAAGVRTARKLGALPVALADEIASIGRRAVRFEGPLPVVDYQLLARLAGGAGDLGSVVLRAGPVTAIRSLRHLDSLDDARKLRRVSEAMGPRTARTFEALGAQRVFAALTRVSRAALRIGGLAAAAVAFLLSALAALGQVGLGRLLRPRPRAGA